MTKKGIATQSLKGEGAILTFCESIIYIFEKKGIHP